MGKTRVIDKEMSLEEASQVVMSALQAGSLTTAQMQRMFPGYIPLGDRRGAGVMWDIDLAVNQPLVLSEQLHIAGLLDGREEDYDLETVTIPNGANVNTALSGQLTVPSGQVWFVNAVRITLPADQGGSPSANWHCSLWEDRAATPSVFGQPFRAVALNFGPGGGVQDDEFCQPANWWAVTNKPWLLRLPAGAVITLAIVNTGAVATAAMACTIQLFGFVGRPLVG